MKQVMGKHVLGGKFMRIVNARYLDGDFRFEQGDIYIQNDIIAEKSKDEEVFDAKGLTALPGLIDIHLHGALNIDCSNDVDTGKIKQIASYEIKNGITSFLLASMAANYQDLEKLCIAVGEYEDEYDEAKILGINMEAPFISKEKCGAQDSNNLLPLKHEVFHELNRLSNHKIKMVGVAPELDEFKEFYTNIKDDTIVSLAHTNADYQTCKEAFDMGVDHVTHLFNAMTTMHHRELGCAGAVLRRKSCYTEIIGDGNFVCKEMLEFVFDIMDKDKIVVISDQMPPTGCEGGEFTLCGHELQIEDKVACLKEDGTMAGPVRNLAEIMKRMIVDMQFKAEDVVRYMTINPAKSLNIEKEIGSIETGKIADIIFVDEEYNIKHVMKNGKMIPK